MRSSFFQFICFIRMTHSFQLGWVKNSCKIKETTTTSIITSPITVQSRASTTTKTPSRSRYDDTFLLFAAKKSKWDDLRDDEDDDDDFNSNNENIANVNIPYDMKYNKRNCDRSNKNFLAIKAANGPTNDLYCRRITDEEISNASTNSHQFDQDVFWYMGKVARVSDITIEQCIHRQWYLLLHHAGYLRPLELYTAMKTNRLELWVAPGDTEIPVAYNNPSIVFTKVETPANDTDTDIHKVIKNSFVGFQGEVYSPGEEGFRTLRKWDGTPAKPEIQQSQQEEETEEDENLDEFRMPTDEEMQKIFKELEGKDINEVYEEQERRKQEQ